MRTTNFYDILLISFIFINVLISSVQDQNLDCDDAYSCVNGSQVFLTDGTNIGCFGYKSCINNPVLKTFNDGAIYCRGGWSCSETNKFVQCCDESIRCNGADSCTDISNITADETDIDCRGANACRNSIITGVNELQCSGEWSCSNMIIDYNDDVPRLLFRGAFSGAGSIINSNGETQTNNIISIFNGHFSGYNATLHCWGGHPCFVTCHGNGCFNLTMICHDSDACNPVQLSCDESEGTICPNIITYVDHNTTVYNYSSYISSIITVHDVLGSLPSLTIEESIEHEIICQTAPVDSGYNTRCLDWVECDGDEIDLIGGDVSDHICCGGMFGCDDTVITIKSNFSLFAVGDSGFTDGDVTFGNNYNETSIEESNYNSNIYCNGETACADSTIRYANMAHCSGEKSCLNANIFHVEQVLCTGYLSCNSTYIYNPTAVYIAGYNAINDAIIDTKIFKLTNNINSFNNVSINFLANRDISTNVQINCNKGNKCNINCASLGACFRVDIYCHIYAICNISCDFDSISSGYCPDLFQVTTSNPTTIPTITPSNLPSITPTAFPTTSPTKNGTSQNNNDGVIQQLSVIYNYILVTVLVLFVGLFILGIVDGKCFRKNERFNTSATLLCGAYVLDFISGMYYDNEIIVFVVVVL